MALFLIGLIGFFGMHAYSALRSRAPNRDLRKRLGDGRYMTLYGVVSLLFFVALVVGYQRAPDSEWLWVGPEMARTLAVPLNGTALTLLLAAYLPVGRIKRTVHHPMMVATAIWALSHLWIGGDLAKILLFGAFALYAVLSIVMAFRRGERVTTTPHVKGDVIAILGAVIGTVGILYFGHGHYL